MYSIWLLPAEKESQRFQKIIDTLSESFKTTAFEPHLTLYTNISKLTDELFYKISVLAALTNTFDISTDTLHISSDFYKALYVGIRNNKALQEIQQEIQNLFPDSNYEFQPHLSFLYGEFDEVLKKSKIESIKENLLNTFQANQIAIVQTKGDNKNWKVIETFDFHQLENSHLEFVFDTVKNLKI